MSFPPSPFIIRHEYVSPSKWSCTHPPPTLWVKTRVGWKRSSIVVSCDRPTSNTTITGRETSTETRTTWTPEVKSCKKEGMMQAFLQKLPRTIIYNWAIMNDIENKRIFNWSITECVWMAPLHHHQSDGLDQISSNFQQSWYFSHFWHTLALEGTFGYFWLIFCWFCVIFSCTVHG